MTSFASEIWEQPQALRDTVDGIGSEIDALAPLAEKLRQGRIQRVMLTGMGSSYYALVPSVIYLMRKGVTALSIESSELLYYYPETLDARTLLVAVSQSGASVEVRRLVEELKREATLIGVTNIPDSPLERASDVRVHMRAGREETVSSKSYVCSLAALHLLARGLVVDDLTDSRTNLRRIADAVEDWLPDWSARADEMVDWFSGCRFIEFLGRGASYASAMTSALITKECAKFPTEGLGGGQFRHGPMELTSSELGVILFAGSAATRALSYGLACDLADSGARVALIGGDAEAAPGVLHIPLPDADEWIAPIAEIIPVQLFAAAFARSRGVEVGKFNFGSKVTTIE